MKRRFWPWVLAFACACKPPPDATTDFLNRGALRIVTGEAAIERFEGDLVQTVAGAKERAWLAVEGLGSTALAAAMLDALDRGVDLRVVADVDQRDDAGIAAIRQGLESRSEGARLVLVGQALSYSPEPARTLQRESAIDRMTHNVVLIDSARTITWSSPLTRDVDNLWVFDTLSTDIAKDFEDQLLQLLHGVDATTLSFFDGPLKSNNNERVAYPMPSSVWELYFGPEERLMKRVIDEVYAARSSVQIMTPALENGFLTSALKYKARVGKKVEVMVGTRWMAEAQAARGRAGSPSALPRDKALSEALDRLSALAGSMTLRQGTAIGATVVVVDALPGPDGTVYTTRTAVVSHPLPESVPFVSGDISVPSDSFMDGHMWVLQQLPGRSDPDTRRALLAQQRALAQGVAP